MKELPKPPKMRIVSSGWWVREEKPRHLAVLEAFDTRFKGHGTMRGRSTTSHPVAVALMLRRLFWKAVP